jgi:hypothetical protein
MHALECVEALPLASPRIAPSQLPPDIEDFTGRDQPLRRLSSRLRCPTPECTGVLITAVVGKAGVEEHAGGPCRASRALVIPDGQLYVNLRGVEAQALGPRRCP